MGVWGAAIQGALAVDSNIQQGIADGKQTAANVAAANDAAAASLRRGGVEAGRARTAGSLLSAKQRMAFTNSGVDATVGTPTQVIGSTEVLSELDALAAENDAAREAWGYKKHGINFQAQAGINSARRNREMAGTLLTTAGSVASEFGKKGFGV